MVEGPASEFENSGWFLVPPVFGWPSAVGTEA